MRSGGPQKRTLGRSKRQGGHVPHGVFCIWLTLNTMPTSFQFWKSVEEYTFTPSDTQSPLLIFLLQPYPADATHGCESLPFFYLSLPKNTRSRGRGAGHGGNTALGTQVACSVYAAADRLAVDLQRPSARQMFPRDFILVCLRKEPKLR